MQRAPAGATPAEGLFEAMFSWMRGARRNLVGGVSSLQEDELMD
jgi:hypothetical protein